MAAAIGRKFLLRLQPNTRLASSYVIQRSRRTRISTAWVICGCATAAVGGFYVLKKYQRSVRQSALSLSGDALQNGQEVESEPVKNVIQSQRELRFLNFASVEYEGNIYMTPQDFLESTAMDNPRPRIGRARLHKEDIDRYLKKTPPKWKGSERMFRNLHDKGIISYTEYLFLLCVLTKPRSGFRIAFNMFDIDGDERVDKKEFQVLEKILTKSPDPKDTGASKILISGVHKLAWFEKEHVLSVDTTVLVHFFGRKGRDVLTYEDFSRFMENLQTEVLELEFLRFSKGMPTISEEDFARILLRYTVLTKEDYQDYLDRLRKRIPHVKGISFYQFREFCRFLNNLDDFAIAMRIYTMGDQPVSEGEFRRAVKVCTGQDLDHHLIHTVFQIFDIDGDGQLSHKEFISIMKDRLHRGFKASNNQVNQWDAFKGCVKNEMKHS